MGQSIQRVPEQWVSGVSRQFPYQLGSSTFFAVVIHPAKQRALPKVPQLRNNHNKPITKLDELFHVLHSHFDKATNIAYDADFIRKATRSFPPFSLAELEDAIKTCANSSAPGPSQLSWRLLKAFLRDDSFQQGFLRLANGCLFDSIWPAAFKASTTVIIPKPGKDSYTSAKNYRPIALLETPGKLISKLIAKWLQSDNVLCDIAHPLQFGGLAHKSTTDSGLFLTETIVKARNAGHFTSVLALDIAQCFPSLKHEVIFEILKVEGFSPILINFLCSYYSNCTTNYRWNNFFSKNYDINNGVPQGNPLSPVISTLYNSAITRLLFPFDSTLRFNCSSYIDDFILVVMSPSLSSNVDKLEDGYRALAKAFHKLGLAVKPSKTELMHFAAKNLATKRGQKPLQFPIPFASLPSVKLHPLAKNEPTFIIEPTKEWHYLGFFFDPFFSFSSHVSRYTNKALTTVNNL